MQKVIPFWENVGGENPSIFIVEFVQIIKMLIIYSFFFCKAKLSVYFIKFGNIYIESSSLKFINDAQCNLT